MSDHYRVFEHIDNWIVQSDDILDHPPGYPSWMAGMWVYADGTAGFNGDGTHTSSHKWMYDTEAEARQALEKFRLGGRDRGGIRVSGLMGTSTYIIYKSSERIGDWEYLCSDGVWRGGNIHGAPYFYPSPEVATSFLELVLSGMGPGPGGAPAPDESKYMTTVPPDNRGGFLE